MSTQDRRPYETATEITQEFLDACADNLTNRLEMVCEIETPTEVIFVSDRNKYVGDRYYEARMNFPTIETTVGEWLSEELEFSTLQIEVSNVDGRFNHLLQGGADFGGWIGKGLRVRLGLRDVVDTYRTIFDGTITDIGGVSRTTTSLKIVARNRWDSLSVNFPNEAFTRAEFPNLEDDKEGVLKPLILGDWTTELSGKASIPAFVVNGKDPQVVGGARNKVQLVVSTNWLSFLDTSKVYLRRGAEMFPFTVADVADLSVGKNTFTVRQNGTTVIQPTGGSPEPYVFDSGDEFFVLVQGPVIGGYRDNPVQQARYILSIYAGVGDFYFHSSWNAYRDKAAPEQSAIANIKSRVWIGEPQKAISYALSLLEQVRLEAFINSIGKIEILSNHFEDWPAAPAYTIRNWDVERGSFSAEMDERTNINRAQGQFSFDPANGENSQGTAFHHNPASILQVGKAISKVFVYPNLYIRTDVEAQLVETLKLSSAFPETIRCALTWRALLLDVGDFVRLGVKIGAVEFSETPASIRSIGYNPLGLKLEMSLRSLQMVPYPGWAPSPAGIVGGADATILKEVGTTSF